ncbi:MAG: response regulator [bacterium]
MKRILFVDDSPTVVEAAYDELEDKGYVVDVAYNGKKALKLLEECEGDLPHLIVMDIEMPKMKGDEAVIRIKQNPAWQHIPVIALTARKQDVVGEAVDLFEDYLIKPFGFDNMLETIEKIIGPPD